MLPIGLLRPVKVWDYIQLPFCAETFPMPRPFLDRVDLTKKFLEACISFGVDFPIITSVLDAGQSVFFRR